MYAIDFDIFVSGASEHLCWLRANLPRLCPFGRVHLTSSFMTDDEIRTLDGTYHRLHRPTYHYNGYENYKLFCALDMHRLAGAPHFIKLDADIRISTDWIRYVHDALQQHPDTVLFGPRRGLFNIHADLTGPLVQEKLGREIRVANGLKIIGGFYVGSTQFFQRHDRFMRTLLEFLYCFRDGNRIRPTLSPDIWGAEEERVYDFSAHKLPSLAFPESLSEDTLRSLVVHALDESEHLRVVDAGHRILIAGYRKVMTDVNASRLPALLDSLLPPSSDHSVRSTKRRE
jgi:hypothetical protein